MSGVGVSVLSGVGFTEGSTCALEGHVSEGKSPTPVLLGLLMLLLPVASLLLSCCLWSGGGVQIRAATAFTMAASAY